MVRVVRFVRSLRSSIGDLEIALSICSYFKIKEKCSELISPAMKKLLGAEVRTYSFLQRSEPPK